MDQPDPQRVKQLFEAAVERPVEERAAFLALACGADTAIRERVERLLESLEQAGPFLAAPTQTTPAVPTSSDAPQLAPGTLLGTRYRIVGLAGRGGMGEVYRAEDLELDQTVALKLLPEQVGRDPERIGRLRHEVRIARQVAHPNVCRVYDIGEADGRHFLSMEWIEGRDLASVLRSEGRLELERAASIALQVCAGLAAAHDRRVVHRDLKPANVMIDDRGIARITDFGLAELVAPGGGDRALEGTPRYMSPEQLAGGEIAPASDLYSLGLVLYELFTGHRVHSGDTLEELRRQHREPPPPPSRLASDIDPGVERLILRCLDPDPARRFRGWVRSRSRPASTTSSTASGA